MNCNMTIRELEDKIGYFFKNQQLLITALTHSSYTNEQKINRQENYERLEYLGDAVLELVTSEYLYKKHPDMTEGKMSKMRASMVCEPALAYCANEIGIKEYILLGRGEDNSGGRERNSILSDVFEAIIGAIYIDSGFEAAKKHISRFVLEGCEERQLFIDSKSILQEMIQAKGKSVLHYELISEEGPEHNKEFTVAAFIDQAFMAKGKGHNKKDAEQKAAYETIMLLKKG